MPGRLVVCPTPIGNLDDVTPRMREALVSAGAEEVTALVFGATQDT